MNSKIINIFIFLIYALIVGAILYLSSSQAFYGDDYTFGLLNYKEGIFDCLFKTAGQEHGGGYFSLFLTKFFSFGLPILLHIHPADFIQWGQGFIQGIFTILLCLSYIRFISESKNNKFLFLSLLIFFGFIYFFIISFSKSYYILTDNNNFYRYPLTVLFFNIFIFSLYTNIVNKENKFSIKNLIITIFASIFIGCNNELISELTAILILEIILYNIFIKIISVKKKGLESLLLNLDKNFWIPVATFTVSAILYMTSQGFKGLTDIRICPSIHEILTNTFEFLKLFIESYIIDIWILWCVFIIILIFSFYKSYKKSELKKIFIPVFINIALFISIFSLVICAKSYGGSFWLDRPTVKYSFYMINITISTIIFGYITESINLKAKYINLLSLIILLSSFVMIPHLNYFKNIKEYDVSIVYKKYSYIGEKMLRFYYLKNKTPYLINFDWTKYAIEDYPSLYSKTDFVMTPDLCTKENLYTLTYYPKIYKDNKSIKLGLCYSDDALERFYKEGGQLTNNELKHIRFSRLLDDDFVLNRKYNKLTPKKLDDIYLKPHELSH